VQPRTAAVVSTAGPVYLLPDETRTPLATLAAGTRVVVGQVKGEWVQVTFPDAALGPRTGWMRRNLVTMSAGAPAPEDRAPAPRARPPVKPPPPSVAPRPAARLFGSVAFTQMSAAQSFQAITGSETLLGYGGGIQGINLWHGLFAEVAADWSSVDGERVFVFDDEVFTLGIPLKIKTTSIDVVGGWRVALRGRVTPYGGAGVTFLRYEETSDFADDDEDENVSERAPGLVGFAGVEVTVARGVHVAGEVRYRRVKDVFGGAGVSAHFGEDTFGGVGGVVRVLFGR
jgi:opacity protein-like surface antigen